MALGPWNAPPNFVGAMAAGASAGLQARGQDIAESEASDRLRLAYDQLAAEERQRNEANKTRMALATAQMQFQHTRMNLLENYRQERLKEQQRRDEEHTRLTEAALGLRMAPKIHFGPNGEVLQALPTGEVKELRPRDADPQTATIREPLDPNQPFGASVTRKIPASEAVSRMMSATNRPPAAAAAPSRFSMFHPSTWFGPTTAGAPAAAPAAAAPFKEGAIIRSKSDPSKLFKVVNGVPVPMTSFAAPTNAPSSGLDQED